MKGRGRTCPPHYGYSPRVFARAPDLAAETLYVIGGLYGNAAALDEIDRMASLEPAPPRRVFNGDFHWFDAEPALFATVPRSRYPTRTSSAATRSSPGSPAAMSYRERILRGPPFTVGEALGRETVACSV